MSVVLVIGAGAAGLAAARELTCSGRKVLVLEARDRIGGRILTHHDNRLGISVELGAEFVHGLPPQLLEILSSNHIAPVEVSDEQLYLDQNGKVIDSDSFNNQLANVMKALPRPESSQDQSFAEWLRGQNFSRNEKRIATAYVEGFNAADGEKIGVHALVKSADAAEKIAGERQFRLTRPYQKVPQTLLNECDQNLLELQMNAVVEEVIWSKGAVRCRLTDGTIIESEQAIITLPLSLLQSDAVKFSPPLKAKKACLDQLAMGHSQRLVFGFKTVFWESITVDGKSLAQLNFIDADDGPFRTWWTLHPLRAPILVGWNAGPDVIQNATLDELSAIAISKLSSIFGISVSAIEEEMVACHYHDWSADPYALGVYSYSMKGGIEAPRSLSQPIEDTLFFAGEATDFEGNSGYVHGAIASGVRAAREVLSSTIETPKPLIK